MKRGGCFRHHLFAGDKQVNVKRACTAVVSDDTKRVGVWSLLTHTPAGHEFESWAISHRPSLFSCPLVVSVFLGKREDR